MGDVRICCCVDAFWMSQSCMRRRQPDTAGKLPPPLTPYLRASHEKVYGTPCCLRSWMAQSIPATMPDVDQCQQPVLLDGAAFHVSGTSL
jgi:hypothetical protein